MTKLWGGRFTKDVSRLMEQFNDSLSFDKRLWKEEIEASRAYSIALAKAGIFSKSELAEIKKAFGEIEKEFSSKDFKFKPGDEDIHTAIERRLVEKAGKIGKKIHAGRSRNEQVATDERIFLRSAVNEIKEAVRKLQKSILILAEKNSSAIVPSYTHLQQAQLVSLGHYFMSLFFMLENDLGRFTDTERRINVLPLGSGAVAGSTIKLDRNLLKQELDFDSLSPNSIAAVSDRDFMTEFMFAVSQTLVHLSRFAEDFIIWSSIEFGFVELGDLYSTGSSMMPQKKNPDSLELIRGKAARVIANLNTLLILQKGLPLTYSKDLQEDKEPLFDSVDTLISSLKIFTGAISTAKVRKENLLRNVDDSIYATDIADYLTEHGVPFREAHKIVGKLVLWSISENKSLRDFSLEELSELAPPEKGISSPFDKKYFEIFDPIRSVERHDVYGGTNSKRVKQQIRLAREILKTK
jgi:argininosuccinate lyase